MIYLLTAIGLPPGGSITVHIYTQTIHRTTQLTIMTLCNRFPAFRNSADFTAEFHNCNNTRRHVSHFPSGSIATVHTSTPINTTNCFNNYIFRSNLTGFTARFGAGAHSFKSTDLNTSNHQLPASTLPLFKILLHPSYKGMKTNDDDSVLR